MSEISAEAPVETPISERLEVTKVRESFPDALLKVKEYRGDTFLCVTKEALYDIATLLKTDSELEYAYFCECVGVDYSQWAHERDLDGRFEVVYNLRSLKHHSRIFLKVGVSDGETIPTLKTLYLGAEYPEREINDLFGVIFAGNEQVGRFLLPDDWVGHPLRKEYPLGGDDVRFDGGSTGPAVEDMMMPHAGESFHGRTGSEGVSGR